MLKNKFIWLFFLAIILSLGIKFFYKANNTLNGDTVVNEITPIKGDISIVVTTTGVIQPQNRLEIKPSITGRIEEILVKEGSIVKKGDILAWMSSTERAALIDAAISQGSKEKEYWEQVYKKAAIVSPIDAEVIVRSVEPGQTISTGDVVLVLSDLLIVSAQFDETDIGRVKIGQDANIVLDAYPDVKIKAVVDHIAYESELVNNVTIYDVDILPCEVPEFFRSGMSANVEVIENLHKDVLLLPIEAIENIDGEKFVKVKNKQNNLIERRKVKIGLTDINNVEVLSGLDANDVVIVKSNKYIPVKRQDVGINPFMPNRNRDNDKNK